MMSSSSTMDVVLKEKTSLVKYNVKPIQSPQLTGFSLRMFAKILRTPLGSPIMANIKDKNGFDNVRVFASSLDDTYMPVYYPLPPPSAKTLQIENTLAKTFNLASFASEASPAKKDVDYASTVFRHWSIEDYTRRYRTLEITPIQVAKALLKAIEASKASLNAIIVVHADDVLAQAALATSRYRTHTPLGPLDGVPVTVKDEVDLKGYETTQGTSFLGAIGGIATEDCLIVARLRAAGALLVGKANMHECGMGTTGHNATFGPARNPYNLACYSGGSSSGSAVAVAAGLVPLAVGCDGGGSIRIPAALCGITGLKATFHRIKMDLPLCPSVGHIGPIANCVKDTALAYTIMAGEESVPYVSHMVASHAMTPPAVHVARFNEVDDLSDLRLGYYPASFNDAAPAVVSQCQAVLTALEARGATLVEIALPHLMEITLAHSVSILTEMATHLEPLYPRIGEFSCETQISTELGRSLSSRDFLAAQKVRAFAMRSLEEVFESVDVIISPATAITAPTMPKAALVSGESNLAQTASLMRYVIHGNFCGVPGIVVPVGYDDAQLPIGVQLQASHWKEALLLRLAHACEQLPSSALTQPSEYYSILDLAQQEKEESSD